MELRVSIFRNIWLADDDIDDREVFEDAVKQILPSTTVTTFLNGELLMDALHAGQVPDILFLDINMPCKDGMDCLKEIRAMVQFSRLPIIMFSSSVQPKHVESAYGFGANLYYSKPTTFYELIAGLSNLFRMDWTDPYTITSNHYINSKFVAYKNHLL